MATFSAANLGRIYALTFPIALMTLPYHAVGVDALSSVVFNWLSHFGICKVIKSIFPKIIAKVM